MKSSVTLYGFRRYVLLGLFLPFLSKFAYAEKLEVFSTSETPINGVAITSKGRVFYSMPQWLEPSQPSPSVVERKKDGSLLPYPGGKWNKFSKSDPENRFVNVNAVHFDGNDGLWVVDYGAPFFGPTLENSQKLVKINVETDKVEKVYRFPSLLEGKAKLNDVRVDLSRGLAYLSEFGAGSIIVLDLESGLARKVLDQHYSTRAHPDVVSYFLGQPFKTHMLQVNDIELSPDGSRLFYQATGGPIMYSIETAALRNSTLSDRELGERVEVFAKSTTVGGVTRDSVGNMYLGDVQKNAVTKLDLQGQMSTVVQDDRLLWPDAMTIHEGYLYVPCPQIRLLGKFHGGKSQAKMPFSVYRYKLD
ncbi:L-dopachrome tautomerase-related protein [uncultured Pseudoteredinibacter sp.]|uniref:L-dopachrome tautomerase-related protein n=1 Tax=uncultured Pseudoteredinibacter sp. TaxID=1641701 RepID=UPI002631A375|nr:L-dopachrome tautomerase-related protein [uncultured Pseudoteredinibacter sp.]